MRDSEGSTELHVACVAQEDEAGGQKGVALALDPKGCGGAQGKHTWCRRKEGARGEGFPPPLCRCCASCFSFCLHGCLGPNPEWR